MKGYTQEFFLHLKRLDARVYVISENRVNVGGKISVARQAYIAENMTLTSREREMCFGNSDRRREDRDEGKGGILERDRRLSNRISKA